ncbi:hypothetical protein [Streptomyces sp. NPDC101150]|uniref:hypothetical protein n=1 Tax=Streptomyces sp. NPDC101150 TaxID=3366114 RepID=UPI0037F943A6
MSKQFPTWGHAPVRPPTAEPEPKPTAAKKKPRRVFMWVFLAVQVLFLIWIIAGAASGGGSDNSICQGLTGSAYHDCVDAGTNGAQLGTAIGVGLIVAFWAAVDFIMVTVWAVVRLARRR